MLWWHDTKEHVTVSAEGIQTMYKKAVCIAFGASLIASPALADAWDILVTNGTGKPIYSLAVSPKGTNVWQANATDADLKHSVTLQAGGRTTVHFDKGSGCSYDLRATFQDGSSKIWQSLNVCDESYFTIKISANGSTTYTAN